MWRESPTEDRNVRTHGELTRGHVVQRELINRINTQNGPPEVRNPCEHALDVLSKDRHYAGQRSCSKPSAFVIYPKQGREENREGRFHCSNHEGYSPSQDRNKELVSYPHVAKDLGVEFVPLTRNIIVSCRPPHGRSVRIQRDQNEKESGRRYKETLVRNDKKYIESVSPSRKKEERKDTRRVKASVLVHTQCHKGQVKGQKKHTQCHEGQIKGHKEHHRGQIRDDIRDGHGTRREKVQITEQIVRQGQKEGQGHVAKQVKSQDEGQMIGQTADNNQTARHNRDTVEGQVRCHRRGQKGDNNNKKPPTSSSEGFTKQPSLCSSSHGELKLEDLTDHYKPHMYTNQKTYIKTPLNVTSVHNGGKPSKLGPNIVRAEDDKHARSSKVVVNLTKRLSNNNSDSSKTSEITETSCNDVITSRGSLKNKEKQHNGYKKTLGLNCSSESPRGIVGSKLASISFVSDQSTISQISEPATAEKALVVSSQFVMSEKPQSTSERLSLRSEQLNSWSGLSEAGREVCIILSGKMSREKLNQEKDDSVFLSTSRIDDVLSDSSEKDFDRNVADLRDSVKLYAPTPRRPQVQGNTIALKGKMKLLENTGMSDENTRRRNVVYQTRKDQPWVSRGMRSMRIAGDKSFDTGMQSRFNVPDTISEKSERQSRKEESPLNVLSVHSSSRESIASSRSSRRENGQQRKRKLRKSKSVKYLWSDPYSQEAKENSELSKTVKNTPHGRNGMTDKTQEQIVKAQGSLPMNTDQSRFKDQKLFWRRFSSIWKVPKEGARSKRDISVGYPYPWTEVDRPRTDWLLPNRALVRENNLSSSHMISGKCSFKKKKF